MGVQWVRVDVGLARNSKVLALVSERDGFRAAFVYICGLGYAGEQSSDGFVPRYALTHIHGRPKDAALLVKYRLWLENGSGWQIPDWAEFQPTSDENRARSESARHAACTRWHDAGCTCWKESG